MSNIIVGSLRDIRESIINVGSSVPNSRKVTIYIKKEIIPSYTFEEMEYSKEDQ